MKYLLLFLISFNVYGGELLLEHGERNTFFARPDSFSQATYSAVALRVGEPYFIEFIQAGWHGKEFARFTGVGIGLRTKKKWFAEYVISGIHLTKKELADQSGNYQALLTTGIGRRFDNFYIALRLRHLSNGNTEQNNHGRDFWVVGLSIKY